MRYAQARRYKLLAVISCTTLLPLLLGLLRTAPAYAGGAVTDCSNDSEFVSKLAGGGLVTFNCGGTNAPATIVLSSFNAISTDTTIEGGGIISLDGNNGTKQFEVNSGATLTLSHLSLVNGLPNTAVSSGFGGCIYVDVNSRLMLSDVLMQNCHTPVGYAGGAIFVTTTATLHAMRSTFRQNGATHAGGIGSQGTVIITASTLMSNAAVTDGGGMTDHGLMTLKDSTVSGNTATNGGGIAINAMLFVTNSTFSNNTASNVGGGIASQGSVWLMNVTLSRNAASSGGGVYQGGFMNVKNTILAYSPTGNNCSGGFLHSLYSISSDMSCGLSGTVKSMNPNGLDPLLSTLANYGGPTLVHMPKLGSPAIDGVVGSDAPGTDQRGVIRPQGGAIDIGAVERRAGESDFPPVLFLPVAVR